ncbi:MAG TPA: hypothetical protein VF548_16955 [Allosphingosinicella sp.]
MALINGIWGLFNAAVSTVNLPADTSDAWEALMSVPGFLPFGIAGLSLIVLGWSFLPPKQPQPGADAPSPPPPFPPHPNEHFGARVMRPVVNGMNVRPGSGSDIWDRIDDKERETRDYQAKLAAGRAAIKVKAELMRDRLATRNHSYGSSESDSPSTASYLAALWDAEERGEIYDEYHRSTFALGLGKGAPMPEGDTVAEVQRNVRALKEKRRKASQAFQNKRRSLIASGRDLAHRFRVEKPGEHWENWVRKQRAYMDITPHLGDEYQASVIRGARTVHMTNDGSSYPEAMFLRELARLEKEWGLV